MQAFLTLFTWGGIFIGFIIPLIFFFYRKWQHPSNKFLAISIFSLAYPLFLGSIILNGSIADVPHLFRTGYFFIYLVVPGSFLYVKTFLNKGRKLSGWYFLLFLPAFIYLVDYFPFFLLDGQTKASIIRGYSHNDPRRILNWQEGWLFPGSFHNIVRYIFSTGLLIWQTVILWKSRKNYHSYSGENSTITYRWLWVYTLLYYPLVFPGALLIATGTGIYGLTYELFMVSLTIQTVCIYLFFNPRILYGRSFSPSYRFLSMPAEDPVSLASRAENLIDFAERNGQTRIIQMDSEEIDQELFEKIEKWLQEEKAFLDTGLSLPGLANLMDTTPHQLSAAINKGYGMNFNELVNRYRIEHFLEVVHLPENKPYSMDAIARMSGFRSRSTFFQAFKKNKGETPSVFLRRTQESENEN